MKRQRITFNAERMNALDVCTLFREAQDNHCKISFSDLNVLIHIDTKDEYTFMYFMARKESYSGEDI